MIVDPEPSLTPSHMEVDEEESIRKEPLKSENVSINPGLKRSYSSPNLVLQVKKLKANHQVNIALYFYFFFLILL